MLQRKPWLVASVILMATYIGYILWAKYAKVIGSPPVKLDETGEFLLFLAAIVAFTFQVFAEDRGEDAPHEKDPA